MNILTPQIPKELTATSDAASLMEDDAELVELIFENQIISGIEVKGISPVYCLIKKSNLSLLNAEKFDISNSQIKNTDLSGSKFTGSSWRTVSIDGCRCSGIEMQDSTIKNVSFTNSKLDIVNFRYAKIENMIIEDCVLDDADFYGANLKNVEFINCRISKATFSNAKMQNVNLSKSTIEAIDGVASLRGVTINYDQLMQLAPYFAAEAGIKVNE